MSVAKFTIRLEQPNDHAAVEQLTQTVFGPGMYVRAAYALREGVSHEADLSFVAIQNDAIVGSVRLTRIFWGDDIVLMLGPLGVLPDCKNQGIGKALMRISVDTARPKAQAGGCPLIMLVGDRDYYAPFGFVPIPPEKISLPRPADPARVLACELIEGALAAHSGATRKRA